MLEDPCKVFCELAQTTWNLLGQCHALKIRLDEDAITTLLLTNIATRLRSTVLYADSRAREAETGCDLELLIGSATDGWCRFALQAKRISVPTGTYHKLDHKVGKARVPQIDLLRSYARKHKAFPLYLFYNHLVSAPALYPSAFGCSIAPISVVGGALATWGARNFDWIHRQPGTVHWSNLVCPSGSSPYSARKLHFQARIVSPGLDGRGPFREEMPESDRPPPGLNRREPSAPEMPQEMDWPEFFTREIPPDIRAWREKGKFGSSESPHDTPLALAIIDTERSMP
ncbi:hypothetical protein J2X04_000948 [Lysobacter niabensis]|uniref:Uncharacterized protein n=1 Tax=Agrilutibacter niabensis TaxID=380628 RepID=A0ABU1VM96_9GAMM|nr:hypothetical protein [Lysobacter niabensis]